MGTSKGKKNTKKKTTRKPKKSETLSTGDLMDGFSRWEVASFVAGLCITLFAVFMVVSMTSFIFTGNADMSKIESSAGADAGYANVGGWMGANISNWCINGMFGIASFLAPVFLVFLGLRLMKVAAFTLVRKFIFTVLAMVWLSVCLATIQALFISSDTFINIGGNHGDHVVDSLMHSVGKPGLFVVLIVSAILVLMYLSAERTINTLREMARLDFFKNLYEDLKHADDEDDEDEEAENDTSDLDVTDDGEDDADNTTSLMAAGGDDDSGDSLFASASSSSSDDGGEFFTTTIDENGQTTFDIAVAQGDDSWTPVDSHVASGNVEASSGASDEEVSAKNSLQIEGNAESADGDPSAQSGQMQIIANETELGDGTIERGDINTPFDPKLELEFYKYPTIDLLKPSEQKNLQVDMDEQRDNQERIIHVLKTFGVEITHISAKVGPTITLYEIVPVEGTRINKIRNLEDDIALSIAAVGIRIIAPIPGKGTIGIEVPNKKPCIVPMESVLNSKVYQESKMELPCAIGKTISNEVFMFDLAKAPHLLVAGATGQGKSVGLNAIVTSLLYKKHPSELKIVMIDPKKVEFSIYSPIENHFLARLEEEEDCIITDVKKVVKTLNSLCKLMDDRYALLKKAGVRNIIEYNEKFKSRRLNPEHGHEFMPYIVVVVDEFGDLIMTAGKEVELPICRIAQLARAVGIHMIIATQRPQASIISGAIKTNFPTRIAFKVSSMMDSRVILDRPGAQQLIGRGDLLYLSSAEPVRVQCAFIDTPEVSDVCSHIARQQSYVHPLYLPEVMDAEGDAEGGMASFDKGKLDSMFAEVANYVVTHQNGSTSMIQRNYSLGYNRAAKIMDQLEKMGVVGPPSGSKPREVLIKDPLTLEGLLNTLA